MIIIIISIIIITIIIILAFLSYAVALIVVLYTASPPTHPTPRTAAFRIQDPWNTKKTKVRKYFNILLFILFYIFIILTQFLCLYYETTGMINKLKYCIFRN